MKGRRLSLTITTLLLIHLLAVSAPAETLTLGEGIREAVAKSRTVKMAQGDESIARDESILERARMLPQVSAHAGGTALAFQPGVVFGSQAVPTAERYFLTYGIGVRQTLYDFSGNASRYGAGLEKVKAAQFEITRLRNIAAVEFALSFFDLLDAERMTGVAEKEVERLDSHRRDAGNLHEAGIITRNDLLQAEVRLSDARQRLIAARNLRALNASRVNNALRRPLDAEVIPRDLDASYLDRLSSAVSAVDLPAAWEAASARRPELLMAEAALRSAGHMERSKKAGYYPTFFMQGGYDFTGNRYQVRQGNWQVALGLSMDIFNGGAVAAEVSKAAHQRERLLEDRQRLRDAIRLEVERYLLEARSARERVAVTRDAVQQAEENLRINTLRYQEGVGTATEVLDAVTLLSVAESNFYHSMYDLAKAEIAVRYAMGEDLTEVAR